MTPVENCSLLSMDMDKIQGVITIHTFLATDLNDFIVISGRIVTNGPFQQSS